MKEEAPAPTSSGDTEEAEGEGIDDVAAISNPEAGTVFILFIVINSIEIYTYRAYRGSMMVV